MTFTTLLVSTLIFLVAGTFVVNGKRNKATATGLVRPPAVEGHFLLRNLPQLIRFGFTGLHIDYLLREWSITYGRVFTFQPLPFGGPTMLVVIEPEAVKEVCVTRNYPKSPSYVDLEPLIGKESMLTSDDETWRRHRSAFNPAFSNTFMKSLFPIFVQQTHSFLQTLDAAASTGSTVKMHLALTRLTLNIIASSIFGGDFTGPIATVYSSYMRMAEPTIFFAEYQHWKLLKMLPWVRKCHEMLHKEYDAKIRQLVEERLQSYIGREPGKATTKVELDADEVAASIKGHKDILSAAVASSVLNDGKEINMESLISQIKTFLFAGHDTTSSLLAWTFYHLSHRPDVEAKVMQEIDTILVDQDAPTFDQIHKLVYIPMVIKEVLRLRPPASTARYIPPGETLLGKYDVGNTICYLPTLLLQRDIDIYGPDAEVFRPERFTEELKSTYSFIPFSKGPRDCIGQRFALLEAKVIIMMIYKRFYFRPSAIEAEETAYSITSRPKNGVQMRIYRR